MADFEGMAQNLIIGNAPKTAELVKEAIDEGTDAQDILNQGLIAGMDVVGERFRKMEIWVPEVLISARAMKAGMALLRPILAETGVPPVATSVSGTVKGDLHDIGKNLVMMMLEGTGFVTVDLGVDTQIEKFVEAYHEHEPDVICMSALLTTTMPNMEKTIDAFVKEGIRDKVIMMVGGAPVTQEFADSIGADGYAPDSAGAVVKAKELLGIEVKS
jgi:5-methyltetrahydrofolate--homocysteine methyltransferase